MRRTTAAATWGTGLRVRTHDDLDEEVKAWLCEAYRVGCQDTDPSRA